MSDKKRLAQLMDQRNPLSPQREVVTPVNLYESPQVDKTTSAEEDKSTKPQVHKTTRGAVRKPAKPQVVKYTTHLKPETIKAVKQYAVAHEVKDYEVVQQALDTYLKA